MNDKKTLFSIMTDTAEFYRKNLYERDKRAVAHLRYLKERGLALAPWHHDCFPNASGSVLVAGNDYYYGAWAFRVRIRHGGRRYVREAYQPVQQRKNQSYARRGWYFCVPYGIARRCKNGYERRPVQPPFDARCRRERFGTNRFGYRRRFDYRYSRSVLWIII